MRDAVENLSVSEAEKLTTRRNTPRRRSRAMAAATREASSPTRTAAATINRVRPQHPAAGLHQVVHLYRIADAKGLIFQPHQQHCLG